MASQAQIEANRRNSQKSTGPNTLDGKASSALNALKTGAYAESVLIYGEDADTLEALRREYAATCRPVGPREQAAVDSLVHADWLLRRMRRVEALLWNDRIEDLRDTKKEAFEPEWAVLLAWDLSNTYLERIQRRLSALDRAYTRALGNLQRLQANRPPVPEPEAAPPEPLPSVIGFVSLSAPPTLDSNPLPPAAARFSPTLGHIPQPQPWKKPANVENVHMDGPRVTV
jgi:hypothetical protein